MQRKTLLSACIALALSGQGWAADITEIETTTGEKKNSLNAYPLNAPL